jgi:arylsulfatase A
MDSPLEPRKALGPALALCLATAAFAQDRPNVVIVLADDLGFGSVGAYGADPALVRTPHIDQLAKDGIRFDQAYTTGSVCSPTRYDLLTARYSWRTRLKHAVVNENDPLLIEDGRETIASWLKRRGYQTAQFGKWHLGYGAAPFQSLAEAAAIGPNRVGFDYHFGVPNNMDDVHKVYVENDGIFGLRSRRTSPYGRSYYGKQYAGYDAPQRNEPEIMEVITEKAIAWIDRRDRAKPFFIYFAPVAVHHPIMPSERMRGTSSAGAYGDFIHDLDYSVGQLMNALQARGLDRNTVFIFTSDNGGDIPEDAKTPERQAIAAGLKINGDHRGDKHQIYNGGFRVPLVIRWPAQLASGAVATGTVSTIDLFPTLAEIIDRPLPVEQVDGRSFRALLTPPGDGYQREDLVLRDVNGRRALVSGRYKYISDQFPPGAKGPKVAEELYDLTADPGETKDLAGSKPEVVAELRQRLARISRGD